MKRLLLFLLLFYLPLNAEERIHSLINFSGYVDIYSAELIPEQSSPDLLNVRTDGYSVWKRQGYDNYNTTALTGAKKGRSAWSYDKTDGTNYIVVNSSSSCFADTNGNEFTAIVSGLNSNYVDDYATVKDSLYRDNGSDTPGKWNGSTYTSITAAVSTGMVTGKYIEWFHNRLFKAGVASDKSVIYYSEVLDPDNIATNNYINVAIDDGDVITGLFKWGDKLICTKTYSIWEIIELQAGKFIIRAWSNKIGCLYDSTIAELKGWPVWMSHRGIERYSGSLVEADPLSWPIDNLMSSIVQIIPKQQSIIETSGADFSDGTVINNVSTTTILGSVYFASTLNVLFQSTGTSPGSNVMVYGSSQGVTVSTPVSVTEINFWTGNIQNIVNTTFTMEIRRQSNGVAISTFTVTVLKGIGLFMSTQVFSPALLLDGTTGYDLFVTTSSFVPPYWRRTTEDYSGGVSSLGPGLDYKFRIHALAHSTSGQYISDVKTCQHTGTTWNKWGVFDVTDVKIGTGSVAYYMLVSTSSNDDLYHTISVYDGITINSSTGPYAKWRADFDTSVATDTVRIDDATINWYTGATFDDPQGFVFEDEYYLAVSTDSDPANDIVLVYQGEREGWTIFNNMSIGCACISRGKLYTIDGNDTGIVYQQDVEDLYNDNGSAYDSHWISKLLDFGNPIVEKKYSSMRIVADNSGSWNLNLDYKLGGYGSWQTKTISLSGNGLIIVKRPFDFSPKHYHIQYKVGNSNANEYFEVKAIHTIYQFDTPR